MSMAARSLQDQLAQRLGLGREDVEQQVWPRLQRAKNSAEAQKFLIDMLGDGPETKAFIRDYAALRAAQAQPTPSTLARPSSQPSQQRGRSKAEADFLLRLPAEYKTALHDIDLQIESLTLSSASTETAPSKRQLKKARTHACFCHARLHPLSTFTPMCPRCALPLCKLHPPLSPCPSCAYHPILTTSARHSYLEGLAQDRSTLLDRARDEMRREPERFPDLVPSRATGPSVAAKAPEQPRVVLSIGKKGSATRTTYKTKPATPPPVAIDKEEQPEEPVDPRDAPFIDETDAGVIKLKGLEPKRPSAIEGRPFANPGALEEVYRPPERVDA